MLQHWLDLSLSLLRSSRLFLANPTVSTLAGAVGVLLFAGKHKGRLLDDKETAFNALIVFVSAYAVLPAVSVLLLSFDEETCRTIKVEQKVIFAGGLILILNTLQGLKRTFK